MTDTIHTVQLTEAEMRAYESGRRQGFDEGVASVCNITANEYRGIRQLMSDVGKRINEENAPD